MKEKITVHVIIAEILVSYRKYKYSLIFENLQKNYDGSHYSKVLQFPTYQPKITSNYHKKATTQAYDFLL